MRLLVLAFVGLAASIPALALVPSALAQQLPYLSDGFRAGDYRGNSYRGDERGDRGVVQRRPSQRRKVGPEAHRPVPEVCHYYESPRPGWTCY